MGNSMGKKSGLLEQRYTGPIINNFSCLKQSQITTDRAFYLPIKFLILFAYQIHIKPLVFKLPGKTSWTFRH